MRDVLYTSKEVRKAIHELFSRGRGRRIAITAFVGRDAQTYLPKCAGLDLVCWPRAGGTNPSEIRRLMAAGVKVKFANNLHMKVYWAAGVGCVITSANLSTNALGAGELKEAGILLDSSAININKLLAGVKMRKVTREALLKLDREHKEYTAQNPTRSVTTAKTRSFDEWWISKHRERWRIGWFDSFGGLPKDVRSSAEEEFGRAPSDWLYAERSDYRRWDWILKFNARAQNVGGLKWMMCSSLVRVGRGSEDDYPYIAIQNARLTTYERPPFALNPRFRRAFARAVRDYGVATIKSHNSTEPPSRLVTLMRKYYGSATRR